MVVIISKLILEMCVLVLFMQSVAIDGKGYGKNATLLSTSLVWIILYLAVESIVWILGSILLSRNVIECMHHKKIKLRKLTFKDVSGFRLKLEMNNSLLGDLPSFVLGKQYFMAGAVIEIMTTRLLDWCDALEIWWWNHCTQNGLLSLLTYWGLNKMANILLTFIMYSLQRFFTRYLQFKVLNSVSVCVHLTLSHHWFS